MNKNIYILSIKTKNGWEEVGVGTFRELLPYAKLGTLCNFVKVN